MTAADVDEWGRAQALTAPPWSEKRWRRVCAILGRRIGPSDRKPDDFEGELMPGPTLISTVYRCQGCRHKGTYGADHTPLPANCPGCGEPWTGQEVYADEHADN